MPKKSGSSGTSIWSKMKTAQVMREFKRGNLRTSAGTRVTDPKQAIAVAMSESGTTEKPNEQNRGNKWKIM